ncbi:MAG TPA: CsgG/HfaB family protein [Myxococcales bacterium]|nr:CsgG/HfaB family protein [Myxococcales bacterium]
MRGNPSICFPGALSAIFLLSGPALAQGKIRIAIWEFENHADAHYWFSKDLGPAARNQIDTEFSENQALSGKFSVVERDKLNLVLKEQGLATAGAVDPTTAAKVGKILGVKYVVMGGIDKFNIDVTKAAISMFGVGGQMVQANATINLRFVDTTTAERVLSVAADGEVRSGGGTYKGTSLSRDAEWGIASDAIQKASKAVVEKLASGDYLARVASAAAGSGVEGKIIKVEGDRAWINLGALSGIKVGDKFAVYTIGEALIDPDTGAKLGADERRTGNGAVVEVQSKFAVINFTGTAKAKDAIRKE